ERSGPPLGAAEMPDQRVAQEGEPRRRDQVQGTEFPVGIPPFRGIARETLDLGRVERHGLAGTFRLHLRLPLTPPVVSRSGPLAPDVAKPQPTGYEYAAASRRG